MAFIVCIIRYLIYPIVYVQDSNMISTDVMVIIILLMSAEMLFVFFTINIFYKYKRHAAIANINCERQSTVLPIASMLLLSLLFITGVNMIGNNHLITEVESASDFDQGAENNVVAKFVQWAKFFVVTYLVNYFYSKYRRYSTSLSYWIVALILFSQCLFYNSTSRLSVLIPLITGISVMYKLFLKKSYKSIAVFGTLVGTAIYMISIVKFFGEGATVDDSSNMFSEPYLNAYFGGFHNMQVGLLTFAKEGVKPLCFFGDFFQSTMGISKYFTDYYSTPDMFNVVYYGSTIAHDQIMPTITQGLIYFSPLFCFIPTILMTLFVCYCDEKWFVSADLYRTYMWAYLPVIVGWALPGNFCHLAVAFTNNFLPMLFLVWVNEKLKLQY